MEISPRNGCKSRSKQRYFTPKSLWAAKLNLTFYVCFLVWSFCWENDEGGVRLYCTQNENPKKVRVFSIFDAHGSQLTRSAHFKRSDPARLPDDIIFILLVCYWETGSDEWNHPAVGWIKISQTNPNQPVLTRSEIRGLSSYYRVIMALLSQVRIVVGFWNFDNS